MSGILRQGRPASPGMAWGPIWRWPEPERHEAADGPPQGAAELRAAIARGRSELESEVAAQEGDAAEILAVQLALLEDDTLAAPAFAVLAGPAAPAAAVAWRAALEVEIAGYQASEDATFRARAADLIDLRDRVLRCLLAPGHSVTPARQPGSVLVAPDLTPSRFLAIDWSGGGAVVLEQGSAAAHVALLARGRGVPMVVAVGAVPAEATQVLVEGDSGWVTFDPDPARAAALSAARRGSSTPAHPGGAPGPAFTAGGERVEVLLNVSDPAELEGLDPELCDGIGLVRSEFLLQVTARQEPAAATGPAGLPDEASQQRAYEALLAWSGGRPVTVRTLDLGGDKPLPGITAAEAEPALGLRGLRLTLGRPELLRPQLRALARAAVAGDLRVLLPMVTVPQEFVAAAALLEEVVAELGAAGLPCRRPPLGMMVEVPAAALTSEMFPADFYAIGSNDLAQYTLAASRSDEAFETLRRDGWPAVELLIARTLESAGRKGVPVCLCGEAAADPARLEGLLRLGLRAVSVPAKAVAAVKRTIAAAP
ncbi:putative PEP-binding protein [Synechococcus sp. CBW1107]|uniref:putative PEP-binding protein n=1 Tax=Synechococcus sp. CBW1107 TaxID=2789857 RepID=UPI002AD281E7|nr:putative PEP-binding protein [Synechococcus sp. CBW1107]CAK6694139.1 Phosphoenolpyruvate-protein phosphotransferase [Synechococcus sp. CBW1107]